MSACTADPPHRPAAYPFPQLVLTLGHGRFHLDIAGEAEAVQVDARDIEGLLATIGRWAFRARSQSEGNRNV